MRVRGEGEGEVRVRVRGECEVEGMGMRDHIEPTGVTPSVTNSPCGEGQGQG